MKIQDSTLANKEKTPWRLFTPEGASKEFCVLWIQGWSSSMDSHREGVERMAQKSNVPFATLDYAGHGLSKIPMNDSTRKQQHQETIGVFDEVKNLGYEKIIVIDGSWGGYMAALLCGKRPVHAVVLRVPANYPDDEFGAPFRETSRDNKDYSAYIKRKGAQQILTNTQATKSIRDYNGLVYVIEHELDEVVPRTITQHYFEAAKRGNYLLVPNTKHSPKLMKNPKPHFEYIEHWVVAILEAIKLQEKIA